MSTQHEEFPWGLMAQFAGADELLAAADGLRGAGVESIEAFTPFPVDGLNERLGLGHSPMPWIILGGGILGGASVFALEVWINLDAYRINIGGRPLYSWPVFIPPAFEGAVLIASLFAVVGVILVCGLPRLHHPVFEVEAFKRASTDGFFLAVALEDTQLSVGELRERFEQLGATQVWEAPHG